MKTVRPSIVCMASLTIALSLFSAISGSCAPNKATLPFAVYTDAASFDTAFIPSGYMGTTSAIKMDPACTTDPHSGKDCLKVEYTATTGWGGVVWQSPANDWGSQPGGWNISGATKLVFWARGSKGGEKVSFLVGIIGPDKTYHDTATVKSDEVLTTSWKQYTISLAGKDLSCIKTGFGWTLAGSSSPTTFYLDDIKYE